jgi:trehalose 6-phosphate phosphatase
VTVADGGLSAAIDGLARTERLLVALDFDGTLAPLIDDPSASAVIPEAARAIARLESIPHTWVAYVSGRPLSSLARFTGADPAAMLIGSHGVEVRIDGERVDPALSDEESERLRALDAALESIVGAPGVGIERKPVGLGVHSRLASAEDEREAQAAARRAAEEIGGFTARGGKNIVEFSVRDVTKGDGVELLRRTTGATGVLYSGDDVTDEDAFGVLGVGDVGIKVGDGATAAGYRVADPAELATVLAALCDARGGASGGVHR